MNWDQSLYLITIQPNPDFTLHNIGTIQTTLTLNDEQLAGILLMVDLLFSGTDLNHLLVQLVTTNGLITLTSVNFKSIHLVTESYNFITYHSDSELWYHYINRLASSGSITSKVPYDITMPYTCRFIGNTRLLIYQFTNPDFIQGAITACNWFGYNWKQFIDNFHLGNTPQSIIK